MTVLLVLLFFGFFVSLDHVLTRRRATRALPAAAPVRAPVESPLPVAAPLREEPRWVSGYELPARLHYHRGHTWARPVGPDLVEVGVDDFARRLIGTPRRVRPPRVGTWVRQGVPAGTIHAADRAASVVAPVEGEVVAVNDEVRRDPQALVRDPYGQGWLYRIRSSALATNLRNLMDGTLAERWTEDARDQLDLRLMALSDSVLQDGGEPAPDFADHLEPDEWHRLVETFLLTR